MVCRVQWKDLFKLSMLFVQFNVPLGTLCHPQAILPGGMLCTISVVKCTMKGLASLLQTVPIMVCCVLHGWSEHHSAKGCAHCDTQFTRILGVIITPHF